MSKLKKQHLVVLFGASNKKLLKKTIGHLESLKPQYISGDNLPMIFSVKENGIDLFNVLTELTADFISTEIGLDSSLEIYSAGVISTSLYGVGLPFKEQPVKEEKKTNKINYNDEIKLSLHIEDYERAAICRDIIDGKKLGSALVQYDKSKSIK